MNISSSPENESVYLETTIISYLAARPSRDLVTAACQEITRTWWEERRGRFDLFASERVAKEAAEGDPDAAARRLEFLRGIPLLGLSNESLVFSRILFQSLDLPDRAAEDAFHIAIAVVSGMDYLLTWNCRHIANARLIHRIEALAASQGYECPVLCTPQELMEE